MATEISGWIVPFMLSFACLVGIFSFYSAGVSGTYTQDGTLIQAAPYPQNITVNFQFLRGIQTLTNATADFGNALGNTVAPSGSETFPLANFVDLGVSFVRIFMALPQIIGGFVYDIANAFLQVLPSEPSGTLITILGILVSMVAIILMLGLYATLRPPNLGEY